MTTSPGINFDEENGGADDLNDSDLEDEIDDVQEHNDDEEDEEDDDYSPKSNTFSNQKKKRFRTQINSFMIQVMRSIFSLYKTPTMAECQALGKELGLSKRVVQVWFQNARAKEKKTRSKQTIPENLTVDGCLMCNVKYDSSLSLHQHLFSSGHINNLKNQLHSNPMDQ